MRRRVVTAVGMVAAAALAAGCGGGSAGESDVAEAPATSASSAAGEAEAGEADAGDRAASALSASTPPAATAEEPVTEEPPTADEMAGVRSREVVERGSGGTAVVPGSQPAPGEGDELTVRVEVEGGLEVDGAAFADFVLRTLNDPRSWAADGWTFSRTDGDADVVVVLASPETSATMCAPLRTFGKLSCRQGPRAILTMYRWVHGVEDYGDDLTGYRHYLVNHEVGHVLGHGHVGCPGPGERAPVMQQQSKDVDPCVPNSWPYP